jgi:hypothetical protein
VLVLCQYVHCSFLQCVQCLSVPHTVQCVGSVSICPLLSSTFCPLSVSTSHCTVCWFCVNMSTAVFYSLSIICQYVKLYRLFVLCHYVHYSLVHSLHCLPVNHNVLSVGSVPLCPLLSSTFCSLSVRTSQFTVYWFRVTMSTVCQYLTLYRLLVLCQYVHCSFLECVHCLSVPHTVPSVGSVSICPLLSSTISPLSIITSHCTVCWSCLNRSTVLF